MTLRIERMRHIAEQAAHTALQDHLGMGDKNAKFEMRAVSRIATWAALSAMREYIVTTAMSDANEIAQMISPTAGQDGGDLARILRDF